MADLRRFIKKFVADAQRKAVVEPVVVKGIFYAFDAHFLAAFPVGEKGYIIAVRFLYRKSARIPQGGPVFSVEKPNRLAAVDDVGHGLQIREGMIKPSAESADCAKLVKALIQSVFQADHRVRIVLFRRCAYDAAAFADTGIFQIFFDVSKIARIKITHDHIGNDSFRSCMEVTPVGANDKIVLSEVEGFF